MTGLLHYDCYDTQVGVVGVLAGPAGLRRGGRPHLPCRVERRSAGKRGFAHLFEHAMFNGSAHVEPGEHMRIIQSAGGVANATTREDRTDFWQVAPSNMLETTLWLEADRMAFFPAQLRLAALRAGACGGRQRVRPSVRRRAGFGNLAKEAFIGAMFPDPHAYHTTVYGVMSELKSTTLDDLRSFTTYDAPNNATLTLSGDFAAADARKLVERYFGGIPRGAAVKHPTALAAPLKSEIRVALEDQRGNTQQLWMGWRGASSTSPDRMALTALSGILSGLTNVAAVAGAGQRSQARVLSAARRQHQRRSGDRRIPPGRRRRRAERLDDGDRTGGRQRRGRCEDYCAAS